MSNQAVGNVYQTIIEEVVNSSRVDFEENGVEESVLEELRLGWQQKLSQLDVAQFPWDPKPDPPPQQAPPPAAPVPVAAPPVPSHSQATFSPQLPQPANGGPAVHNGIKQEPIIKDEPDAVKIKQEPGHGNYGFNGLDDKNNVAANRAAQLVQQTFGNRGTGSINAIQDGLGQQQQQPQQDVYQQGHPIMPPPQQGGPPHPGSLHNAQTDGAADGEEDFEAVLMRRSAAGELETLGRVEVDSLLHQHIAANAQAMEGGGLMLTLKEATKHRSRPRNSRKGKGVGPYDGPDDDEDLEDDEDAINSDLDDSDEGLADDDVEDEGLGSIMLCMYDKVQRVKNKWKCTLKDGVLTVNGKEYVFHKAQGEFEW